MNWEKYNIHIPYGRTSGQVKTTCPNCSSTRGNPKDKSLSCNLDDGTFFCHHCEWKGCVAEDNDTYQYSYPLIRHMERQKIYKKPQARPIVSQYSDKLIAYMANRGISVSTMEELKVSEGEEYMPQKKALCNTVQFNYFRDGELINTKFRTGDKQFKLVQDAELIPYNLDAIKDSEECIICEGEMDALSIHEAGLTNVISVPAGANRNLTWLDSCMETYFDNKKVIIIASDNDKNGTILKNELIRRFGAYRCKVVEYGEGCKDSNDHIVKYGKDSLKQAILGAIEVKVEGVFTMADIEQNLDVLYRDGLQQGNTIGHANFDCLCSFITKMLCVITGIPSYGKSEWLDEMVCRLNIRYGWKFAYFSPENEPLELHSSKLIERLTGERFTGMSTVNYNMAKKHINDNFYFVIPSDDFSLDSILNLALVVVRKYGIKGLVIDPFNYIERQSDSKEKDTEQINKILAKLKRFAKNNDIIIFLVAHPTKLIRNKDGFYDAPDLYSISGSANFNNRADFGLCVHRHFGEDEYTEIHCLKVRFRHLGTKGTAYFKYNKRNGRYTPYEPGTLWSSDSHDNSNAIAQMKTQQLIGADEAAVLPFDVNNPFSQQQDDSCPY